jgi:hypothetical protein
MRKQSRSPSVAALGLTNSSRKRALAEARAEVEDTAAVDPFEKDPVAADLSWRAAVFGERHFEADVTPVYGVPTLRRTRQPAYRTRVEVTVGNI